MGDAGCDVAAEDLTAATLIDVAAALVDPSVHPWVWQPFGDNDRGRQEAIASARVAAEFEYAVVESVESAEPGRVHIYTDQINLTVPVGYRFVHAGSVR